MSVKNGFQSDCSSILREAVVLVTAPRRSAQIGSNASKLMLSPHPSLSSWPQAFCGHRPWSSQILQAQSCFCKRKSHVVCLESVFSHSSFCVKRILLQGFSGNNRHNIGRKTRSPYLRVGDSKAQQWSYLQTAACSSTSCVFILGGAESVLMSIR